MPTPRVLAVAAVPHLGGAEIGLLRLLTRVRDAGWRVTLTTPGPGPLTDAARAQRLGYARIPVGGLTPGDHLFTALTRGAPALFAAASSPEHIVYFNGGASARLLPAAAARKRRTVVHVHDLVDRVPPHWRLATLLLADSQAVKDRLTADLQRKTHVVGCPIEPAPTRRTPPPWGERNGRPVIGFVGRLEPRKAPHDFVAAAAHLKDARLLLIGDDALNADPAYTNHVLQQANHHGVEHIGWVDDAAGVMHELDVLVLPSRAEPFGTVLAEAMNAGTPVVATRVGGLEDVVDDGVTGRLVDPGDPIQLARATREVLEHRDTMGEAGRQRAKRWHADAYAERVMGLMAR